ncbi:MAG: sigma-70 family RNA polymerase sigma factor [Gammaproteobacteria bacterium]|nr:sigma-70 family RNA polymerase sigma factor [Gammaproteobacteria bacterium]MCP5136311.1 sigma-70 family RNA polymerase sigma factor [Gammaproteobacteria bacterium]
MTDAPHSDPDAWLVRRVQDELPYAGEAFARLVRSHERRVYQSCRRYLRDPVEAEDAAQEVFLRVFQSLAGFDARAPFGAWLYRIVHNHCLNRLERDRSWREQWREAESLDAIPEPSAPSADDTPDVVQRTLDLLPAAERELLILRFEAGLAIHEIAEVLELKLSAAKMRLYRAQDRFKELYQTINSE